VANGDATWILKKGLIHNLVSCPLYFKRYR
jgi:hypothetical protein